MIKHPTISAPSRTTFSLIDESWSDSASDKRLRTSSLEPWLWGLGIFLLTAPFAFQLAGIDPTQAIVRDPSSLRRINGSAWMLYAVRMAVMAFAITAMLPYWRQAAARLREFGPVWLFAAWATLTLFWTDTFTSSLNGVMALIPLLITGFCLGFRLEPPQFARSFIYASAFMILFSYIYVFVFPMYGMHQANDATQSVHAGSWRGVYGHKNVFGSTCAAAAATILIAGRSVLPSLLLKIVLLAALFVAIIMSKSATAIALTILTPVITFALVGLERKRLLLAVITIVPIALIAYYNLDVVFGWLGRDPTLTGRTSIWAFVPDALSERPLVGYGYASTTYGHFTIRLLQALGLSDPHNGYLNVLLSVGMIGLMLFLWLAILACRVARRLYLIPETRNAALVSLSIIVAWLIGMMTESQDKPLGSFAALGFTTYGLLMYRSYVASSKE